MNSITAKLAEGLREAQGALDSVAQRGSLQAAALENVNALLVDYDAARTAKPVGAGVEGHSAGPWHGEFYQTDHGASLAICDKDHRVIALIPVAQLGDDEEVDANTLDAETAPRDAFDLPNFRRLLACVNACDGMSTSMLEALRPDVQPFVDDCGRNFVVFSRYELEHGDGAGFWSNESGWVECEDATRFTQAETMTLSLPLSGKRIEDSDASWCDLAAARTAASEWQASCDLEGVRP